MILVYTFGMKTRWFCLQSPFKLMIVSLKLKTVEDQFSIGSQKVSKFQYPTNHFKVIGDDYIQVCSPNMPGVSGLLVNMYVRF